MAMRWKESEYGAPSAGLKNDGWLVRSKVKQMCYVLLGLSVFVLKCDLGFGSSNIHKQLNLANVQSKMEFLVVSAIFSPAEFCFAVIYESLAIFIADRCNEKESAVQSERNCSETYRDNLNNLEFFECSGRCMWRRHSTATDCYNYVFAFDPTAVIALHIGILSIDSKRSSRRSLQRKKQTPNRK